jgi:phytoene/squalene synthetase
VGRLVLHLGRAATVENFALSDSICTGLQLANFWQDVARDYGMGRIYIPVADCRKAGYDETMFAARAFNPAFRSLLRDQVDRAEQLLRAGAPLIENVPKFLQIDVALFQGGGLAILNAIRRQNYDVWRRRPVLGKLAKLSIFSRAVWRIRCLRRTVA